jgi:hypothetical protein
MSEKHVYVRSPLSKVHLAVMRDGVLLSSEACNLDDLDEPREILVTLADLDTYDLCERCFPPAWMRAEPVPA